MQLDDVDKTIFRYLLEGYKVKDIGPKVNLSPRTIEKRIYRACKKNKCKTILQLVGKYLVS